MTDSPAVDVANLEMLREIMAEDFDHLIDTYRNDAIAKLDALDHALADADTDELARLAHSFKGASSNIGAAPLTDLCKQVEDQAKSGDLDAVAEVLPTLHSEAQRVLTTLDALN